MPNDILSQLSDTMLKPTNGLLDMSNVPQTYTPSMFGPSPNPLTNSGGSSGSTSGGNGQGFFGSLLDTISRLGSGALNVVSHDGTPLSLQEADQMHNDWQNHNYFSEGYHNPESAPTGRQVFDQKFLAGNDVPYLSGVGGFATSMFVNPVNAVPIPIGAIAKATGITPALKFTGDWLRGAIKGGEQAAPAVTSSLSKPPLPMSYTDAETKAINDAAGLSGGYLPKMETVPQPFQRFINENPAKFTVSTAANSQLKQLFNLAEQQGLPAGREYEALQDLLSRTSSKTGVGLDELIHQAAQKPPSIMSMLSNIQSKKAYGVFDSKLPQSFKSVNGQVVPEIRNITREVTEPNFTLKGEGDIQPNAGALVPIGNPFVKGAEEVASKAPYAQYGWQSKIGAPVADALKNIAPNGVPIIKQLFDNKLTDTLGHAFQKYYNASPMVANSLREVEAAHGSDLENIKSTMSALAKTHGLTNDEMNQVVHMFEGTPSVNPKVTQAFSDLKGLLENGVKTPEGRIIGTQAELGTSYRDKPILQGLKDDYYPHRYNESQKAVDEALTKAGKSGFSTTGPFNKERQFDTVKEALAAGLKPEMNPYVAIGQRLGESSKAIRNAQLLNKLMNTDGLLSKEAGTGLRESAIPQLNGYHLKPEDESALRSFVSPWTPQNPVLKNALNAYDKPNQLWKKYTTYNSLVHGHNIAYNGMYLGKAKPSYVQEAFKNIKDGASDEWYQRALRAGAVSADRGNFMKNLRDSISNATNPIKDKISYAFHGALWDFDKAMRTGIFREAVEKGATETEAAAKANKFLIDYNNLTPFEKEFMTRVFPFYRWMKGNLPLQAEQWINNTPKQVLYENAKNAVNQSITGQNIGEDGKIDTGKVLPDGSHVKIDPYAPADEPLKLMREGALPFLYQRQNPFIKEAIAQITNHAYYPGTPLTPNGKESMAKQELRSTSDLVPEQYKLGQSAAHAVNSLNPFGSGVMGTAADSSNLVNQAFGVPTKDKPGPQPIELMTKLLGGFSSRSNPEKDAYFEKRNLQDDKQGFIKYLRDTSQPVSKGQVKDANKKIPYPKGYAQ